MTKKTIILVNLIVILCLVLLYNFYPNYTVKKLDKEITIFTQESLLGIHAKMITAQDDNVHVFPATPLGREARNQLYKSDVILSSKPLSQSEIGKELQDYKGLYITIPLGEKIHEKTHSVDSLVSQIELIRDGLSDTHSEGRGYYYDNAGNYIHLLRTTFKSFKARIGEYRPSNFITLGDNLSNYLLTLGIEKYRIKNYTTLEELMEDDTVSVFLKENSVHSLFTSLTLDQKQVQTLQNKYSITVYQLPSLEDDASRWGYVRFIGKIMNDFVAAFDTYD